METLENPRVRIYHFSAHIFSRPDRKDRKKMEEKKVQQGLTQEQKYAVWLALQDPQKEQQIIAILRAAGLLPE